MAAHVDPRKRRWFWVAFALMGVAAVTGLSHLISVAFDKGASGRGFETYRTVWLVEFSYVGVLILFAAILVALVIGGCLWVYEWWQVRSLEKKYQRCALHGAAQRERFGVMVHASKVPCIILAMQLATGTVVGGKIVVEGDPLPEGAVVTILAREADETFEVPPELEAELLESIAQAERGETISAEELLKRLRRTA
jgi:hypothetical protein